jgi:glutathionylspermidine synthase
MDYESIVEFSRAEYDEFMDILAQGNAIFVKAYEFYRKDLAKNLPDFAFMDTLFAEKFPLTEYFLGRYDVIREAGTGIYKFLETNANTPGMITESCQVSQYLSPE